ncbi:hypothetical protein Nepgr_021648 [Nepenthes gracilis]|uniref:Uncharacterized protein n=1 Tax=Nepenthes gracilis TaxID=150966 RepID=A0AAD3SZ51_NEPGR|nr:hypothetical protein Nepgr_021648 [Nepenthes gracilis]
MGGITPLSRLEAGPTWTRVAPWAVFPPQCSFLDRIDILESLVLLVSRKGRVADAWSEARLEVWIWFGPQDVDGLSLLAISVFFSLASGLGGLFRTAISRYDDMLCPGCRSCMKWTCGLAGHFDPFPHVEFDGIPCADGICLTSGAVDQELLLDSVPGEDGQILWLIGSMMFFLRLMQVASWIYASIE